MVQSSRDSCQKNQPNKQIIVSFDVEVAKTPTLEKYASSLVASVKGVDVWASIPRARLELLVDVYNVASFLKGELSAEAFWTPKLLVALT